MAVCQHERARRSHRREREKIFGWLPWRPYRCVDCGQRFFRYEGKPLRDALIVASLLIVVITFAVWPKPNKARTAIEQNQEAALLTSTVVFPTVAVEGEPSGSQPQPTPASKPVPVRDADENPSTTPTPKYSLRYSKGPLYVDRLDGDLENGDLENGDVYVLRLQHDGELVTTQDFIVKNPTRVVVVLGGKWPVKPGNLEGERRYGVGVVKRVRVGRNEDQQLRVVVDLKRVRKFDYRVTTSPGIVEVRLWQ